MVYFKLFFYGLGFETSGPLVQMVFTIGWLIKDWAVLLFLNMVAFGTALMVSRRLASFGELTGILLAHQGSCCCFLPCIPLVPLWFCHHCGHKLDQ